MAILLLIVCFQFWNWSKFLNFVAQSFLKLLLFFKTWNSEIIFCLIGLAYPLIKRIVRKALSLSTAMVVNIWLPFKQEHLFDSTHILSIWVFVKKISNNSCGNRVLSKTVTGSFHAFNCCHTELSMCFQLAVLRFFVT